MKLCVIVLSGGVGSRLWPLSRKLHPKPFIKMSDGLSILQHTFLRLLRAPMVSEIVNVTNKDFIYSIKDQFQEAATISGKTIVPSYILEPFGKNTAAAIAFATLRVIALQGEDAVVLVVPSDHIILEQEKFNQALRSAVELANTDKLVTFGIKPTAAETGYGYIECEGNVVKRFIEKPCLNDAQCYAQSDRFFWNSGMFCFKATTMLAEMHQYCPDILANVTQCFNASKIDKMAAFNIDPETFQAIREDSIDYAIMEKSDKIAFVPCDFGWRDIGTWNSFRELFQPNAQGNVIRAQTVLENVNNCYIESHDKEKLIGAVGIDNLIIVDTPDALLVINQENAQDVRKIYNKLQQDNHKTHELHVTVRRPWGTYTVLEEGSHFKVKRIAINPGGKLSLQMHKHRLEHWVVVAGQALVINGEKEFLLAVGESTYILPGVLHRLSNPSTTELLSVIEVQTGSYLKEDDILRVDDVYERVATP